MHFSIVAAITVAAVAYAAPAEPQVVNQVSIQLPKGCKKHDVIDCAIHLIGTGAACASAVLELGLDIAADLSCIRSAVSTAENINECKACIPHKQNVIDG